MSRKPEAHLAWAIDLRWAKRDPAFSSPCWLGILFGGYEPAPHLRGCRTALWRTRDEARRHLQIQKATERDRPDLDYWRRAVVRPVFVTIRVRGSGDPQTP